MWWGLGWVELWVGNNIMRLFAFLCIADSHTAHIIFLCI